MKTFTIDAENNITFHASRKAARDTGAGVFGSEEQFADLIGPNHKRLVEIWNSLPGVKPVAKFTNRKIATERIWKAVQSLGQLAPAAASEPPLDATKPDITSELPGTQRDPEQSETEPQMEGAVTHASVECAAVCVVEPGPNVAEAETAESVATVDIQAAPDAPAEGIYPVAQPDQELAETEPQMEDATPQTSLEAATVCMVESGTNQALAEAAESLATAGVQAPQDAPAEKGAATATKVPKARQATKAPESAGPREASKTAQLVALLQRKNGATLAEIMEKTGWQKHTIRGFMAGAMKKAGYTVESFKSDLGERTYRISQ
jgi:hypothetical protein